jgi:transposase
MLNCPTHVRLYLATERIDLRRSEGGLRALVDGTFGEKAMAGNLFTFVNRRANEVRISSWDR